MDWRGLLKPGRLLLFFAVGSVMFAPLTEDLNQTHALTPNGHRMHGFIR